MIKAFTEHIINMNNHVSITITYCTKCRFLTRSTWLAQEILTTFEKELNEIKLKPSADSGVFKIKIGNILIWDRKIDDHAINLKLIKQRIRDIIAPKKELGHSDKEIK